MANTTRTPPKKTERVTFIQRHAPALKSGNYLLKVTQTPDVAGKSYRARQSFSVMGPRYALPEGEVVSAFPPPGGLGDYADALPHVVLRHSTRPWERVSDASDESAPWLAVLMFDAEDPPPDPQVITLAELRAKPAPGAPAFPLDRLPAEPQHAPEDRLSVIDVPADQLRALLPAKLSALKHLAHVRQPEDDAGERVGEELAVVVGGRLGRPAGSCVAHLVSLEERYVGGAPDLPSGKAPVRLVSLYSWTWHCLDPKRRFKELLTHADRAPAHPRLPDGAFAATGDADLDAKLRTLVDAGYAPLPHTRRSGRETSSWYRGPLQREAEVAVDIDPLSARSADALLRYEASTGMLDASYAAAWELGRLLTLERREVARALFNWKRAHLRARRGAAGVKPHLPHQAENPPLSPPAQVTDWLERLTLLEPLPFHYLVPDPRMLPVESIRFFQLDHGWLRCLLAGAWSVGRTTSADAVDEAAVIGKLAGPSRVISGLLLRSAAVSGWPQLQVQAWESHIPGDTEPDLDKTPALRILRQAQLSQTVLLVLFDGAARTIDLHPRPESLHFGFDADPVSGALTKLKRDPNTGQQLSAPPVEVPWRDAALRVPDIEALASAMGAADGAHLAVQLISGVDNVRFTRG